MKLTTRETRTIVAALRVFQGTRSVLRQEMGDNLHSALLSDAQLDRLRERIAKAKNINLS